MNRDRSIQWRLILTEINVSDRSPEFRSVPLPWLLDTDVAGQGERISAPIDSTPEYRPQPSAEQRASAAAIKGKDLLNKAGVLGGKGMSKGMKEAKGLFAKGKSRFRNSGSEKVDE